MPLFGGGRREGEGEGELEKEALKGKEERNVCGEEVWEKKLERVCQTDLQRGDPGILSTFKFMDCSS